MIKLKAKLIEVCENPGYAMTRWQLETADGSATSGDVVNIALDIPDAQTYQVGEIYELAWVRT